VQVFRRWGAAEEAPGKMDSQSASAGKGGGAEPCDLDAIGDKRALKKRIADRVQGITSKVNEEFAQQPGKAEIIGDGRFIGFAGGTGGWTGKGFTKTMSEAIFFIVYGRVIEQLTAEEVSRDRCLSKYVRHQSNTEQMKEGENPDFIGIGRADGAVSIDVTTAASALKKSKESIKRTWDFATYERLLKLSQDGRNVERIR